jgi:peptidoglycan/LPS O-acetylase OafA/YrhL
MIPLALASFAITTAIATLSWYFIESPILKRGQEAQRQLSEGISADAAVPLAQSNPQSATA